MTALKSTIFPFSLASTNIVKMKVRHLPCIFNFTCFPLFWSVISHKLPRSKPNRMQNDGGRHPSMLLPRNTHSVIRLIMLVSYPYSLNGFYLQIHNNHILQCIDQLLFIDGTYILWTFCNYVHRNNITFKEHVTWRWFCLLPLKPMTIMVLLPKSFIN